MASAPITASSPQAPKGISPQALAGNIPHVPGEKTILGVDLRRMIVKVVHGFSRGQKIKVIFRGTGAYTTGKLISLPNIRDLAEIPWSVARGLIGYAIHEIGHILLTDWDEVRRSYDEGDLVRKFSNAIEDYRIERELCKRFPGAARDLTAMRVRIHPDPSQLRQSWLRDPRASGPLALTWTGSVLNGFPNSEMTKTLALFPSPMRSMIDRWTAKMDGIVDTTEVVDLSIEIKKEIDAYVEAAKQAAAKNDNDDDDKSQDDSQDQDPSDDQDSGLSDDNDSPASSDDGQEGSSETSDSEGNSSSADDQAQDDPGDQTSDDADQTESSASANDDDSAGCDEQNDAEAGDDANAGDQSDPEKRSDDQSDAASQTSSDDETADEGSDSDDDINSMQDNGDSNDDGNPNDSADGNDSSGNDDSPASSDDGQEGPSDTGDSEGNSSSDDDQAQDGPGDQPSDTDSCDNSGGDAPSDGEGNNPADGTGDQNDNKTDQASDDGAEGQGNSSETSSEGTENSTASNQDCDASSSSPASDTGEQSEDARSQESGENGLPDGNADPSPAQSDDGQSDDGKADASPSNDNNALDDFLSPDASIEDHIDAIRDGIQNDIDDNGALPDEEPEASEGELDPQEVIDQVADANASAPDYQSSDGTENDSDDNTSSMKGASKHHYDDHRFSPLDTSESENLYANLRSTAAGVISTTARTIRRLLASQSKTGVIRNRRDGQFDIRNMNSIIRGTGTCYKREFTNKSLETLLVTLIDFSGSMSYSNHECKPRPLDLAMTGALAIEEATRKTSINTAIYSYSGFSPNVRLSVFKEGKQNDVMTKKNIGAYRNAPSGCTPTAEAMAAVLSRIENSPEHRKILLVLTDGDADDMDLCHSVVETYLRRGIEIIAIGIDSDSVKEWAPIYHVINDVTQLPQALLSTIDPRGPKKKAA